jgi:hypothetical protein
MAEKSPASARLILCVGTAKAQRAPRQSRLGCSSKAARQILMTPACRPAGGYGQQAKLTIPQKENATLPDRGALGPELTA